MGQDLNPQRFKDFAVKMRFGLYLRRQNFNMEAMTQVVSLMLLLPLIESRGLPEVFGDFERQVIVRAGETIRLNCPVRSDPDPIFSWFKDDESIHQGWDRFRMLTKGLKIKNIEVEDSGIYRCRGTNGFGSVDVEYVVFVRANEAVGGNGTDTAVVDDDQLVHPGEAGHPPRWTHYDEMLEDRLLRRPQGTVVRLHCRASGHPRPAVLWFYNGHVITGDEGHVSFQDHQSLSVENVQPVYSGNYMCRVFNQLGRMNFTYTLEVSESRLTKPVILESPDNTTVGYEREAVLQCAAQSEVTPDMKWLKRLDDPSHVRNYNATIKVNGTYFVVLKSETVWIRHDGAFVSQLYIPRATGHDSGMYVCLGANHMGYNYRSAFLTVLAGPPQSSSGLGLPLMVAIAAFILIILIIIIICCVKRKNNNRKPPSRCQTRSPPQVPATEKPHTYSALAGYNHMQNAPSREQILTHYPSDTHSDSSQKMMPMYMPQQMAPPGMPNYHAPSPNYHAPSPNYNAPYPVYQQHQHLHTHTYAQC